MCIRDRKYIEKRYHAHKFIAYFQNYTNTFMHLDIFQKYMLEASKVPDILNQPPVLPVLLLC